MGLSGRKAKQRIGSDPRNLTWADNAAKFGQAYLSKLGWNPSEGLGLRGDGLTSHIKVVQKLNLMGIGAGAQQGGPDSVAWKQSRDYEILLKRLNEANAAPVDPPVDGAVMSSVTEEDGEVAQLGADRKKKRKKDCEEVGDESTKKKRKRKETSDEAVEGQPSTSKSEKKKHKRALKEGQSIATTPDESTISTTAVAVAESAAAPPPVYVPRPMAHRARFLASKRLAAVPSAAVSEILGVAPSTSASGSPSTAGTPAPPEETIEQLTTSTKSVADYFAERLAARAGAGVRPPSSTGARSRGAAALHGPDASGEAPRLGLGARPVLGSAAASPLDEEDNGTRAGLGSARAAGIYASFMPAFKGNDIDAAAPDPLIEEASQGVEVKKKKKKRKGESGEDDKGDKKRGSIVGEVIVEDASLSKDAATAGSGSDVQSNSSNKMRTKELNLEHEVSEESSQVKDEKAAREERKKEKKEKKRRRDEERNRDRSHNP